MIVSPMLLFVWVSASAPGTQPSSKDPNRYLQQWRNVEPRAPSHTIVASSPQNGYFACFWHQTCIAIPEATPTLIDLVEPYWLMWKMSPHTSRISTERPGPS